MPTEPLPPALSPTLRTRVALVTGGARRVGKAIAIELARRGARIAVHANSSMDGARELCDLLEAEYGADTEAFQASLDEKGAAEDLVTRVTRHFAQHGDGADEKAGRLDILVNSAAIWPKTPLEEIEAEEMLNCFNINTVALLMLGKHAGLRMADQPTGGVIINLGDADTAHDGRPQPGYASYHPSKAGVIGLTRSLAIELAQRNPRVRVNAVLPGPVICEHLPNEPEDSADRKKVSRDAAIIATPDGGYGRAEHVAHAVAMIVENPLINGIALPVDGGGRLK